MILGVPEPLRVPLEVLQVVLMAAVPLVLGLLLIGRLPRPVKLGALWVLIALLPYVFLTFRTITRYLYLPSVGVALVVAVLVAGGLRRPAARAALVLLLLAQAAVVNVVISQRLREQRAQDGSADRELADHARRLGFR
jgi:O-antigen ligase